MKDIKRTLYVCIEFNRKQFTIRPVSWANTQEEAQGFVKDFELHDRLLGTGDNLFYRIEPFSKTEVL